MALSPEKTVRRNMGTYSKSILLHVFTLKKTSISLRLYRGVSLSHAVHDLVRATAFIILIYIIKNQKI
jgi:hypothetical protein